jgi:hypothetical protein
MLLFRHKTAKQSFQLKYAIAFADSGGNSFAPATLRLAFSAAVVQLSVRQNGPLVNMP